MALLSDMVPIRGTKGLGVVKEWGSDGVGQIWQKKKKNGIVLLGQVKETGNRRAELKEERGA